MQVESMLAVIENIEDSIAILELDSENSFSIPIKYLPENIQEGMVLRFSIKIDRNAEKQKRDKIEHLYDQLLQKAD